MKHNQASQAFEAGCEFRKKHQWKKAIYTFQQVVELDPCNASAWFMLAMSYDVRGQNRPVL